ncbi:uncharacterized protein LOC124298964 [Neodiprion virginianus]|uniref:uncharacterized protein LOC124298964 n=1 Tax=Neodiprion virginianus TaxID=2961670 RepID=UPI001EE76B58|nr:uncharacterized protein LOC124298964 [Neodiprion virginianus]
MPPRPFPYAFLVLLGVVISAFAAQDFHRYLRDLTPEPSSENLALTDLQTWLLKPRNHDAATYGSLHYPGSKEFIEGTRRFLEALIDKSRVAVHRRLGKNHRFNEGGTVHRPYAGRYHPRESQPFLIHPRYPVFNEPLAEATSRQNLQDYQTAEHRHRSQDDLNHEMKNRPSFDSSSADRFPSNHQEPEVGDSRSHANDHEVKGDEFSYMFAQPSIPDKQPSFAWTPNDPGYYDGLEVTQTDMEDFQDEKRTERTQVTSVDVRPSHDQELVKLTEVNFPTDGNSDDSDNDNDGYDDEDDAPRAPPELQRRAESHGPLVTSVDHKINNDIYFVAVVAGCSAAAMFVLVLISLTWCRLQRGAKAAADVEYPAYGVTGPNKDTSPSGDRRLAQSAQMYHYQHQKQQIIAMESRTAAARDPGSVSEAESDEENEEGDYTVYECPGLAPTGEMEVKNPLFHDDPTPATPAGPGQTNRSSEDHM